MELLVGGVPVSPEALSAAEMNFNQQRFRGHLNFRLKISRRCCAELLANIAPDLVNQLRKDVELVGGGDDLEWWRRAGFPGLDGIFDAPAARLVGFIEDYLVADMINASRLASEAAGSNAALLYIARTVDSVAADETSVLLSGTASSVSPQNGEL